MLAESPQRRVGGRAGFPFSDTARALRPVLGLRRAVRFPGGGGVLELVRKVH